MQWILTVCAFTPILVEAYRAPRVNLTSGYWTGVTVTVSNVPQKVDVFYGVRYAEPPLNSLRFKHPLPRAYNGAQDATKIGHPCIQGNMFHVRNNSFSFQGTSEDCLHVNIYRPQGVKNAPIVVYLHGGSFVAGFNKLFLYDAEELVAREKIIVAVVNYRLSVFGFLYLNHTEAPGNQGLYDMLLATKFIKENAKALGGDPGPITLWGQSAGAIGAGLLMSSPLAKGIFSRVFLQSGNAATGTIPLHLNNLGNGVSTARVLNCVDSSRPVDDQMGDMARCLKKVNAQKLFDAVDQDLGQRYTITFQPLYGIDDLLPEFPFPSNRSRASLIDDVKEVLTSTVSDEGAMFMLGLLGRFQYSNSITYEDYISLAQIVLKLVLGIPTVDIKDITAAYIPDSMIEPKEIRASISNLFKDLLFECPVDLYSDFFADRGVKVYRYLWDHKPSTSWWPQWAGPTHGDDISFTMGSQLDIGNKAEKSDQATRGLVHFFKTPNTKMEIQLIKDSLRMVGGFVKTGVPSRPDGSPWPQYTAKDRRAMRIKSKSFSDVKGPFSDKCSLWEDFLTKKQPNRFSVYGFGNDAKKIPSDLNEIPKTRLRNSSSGKLFLTGGFLFYSLLVSSIFK